MKQNVILSIKAKPGSKTTKFELKDEVIVANIAAPPLDGEANKELIRSLAKVLELKQNQIELKVGATSKYKLVKITSEFSKEELLSRL